MDRVGSAVGQLVQARILAFEEFVIGEDDAASDAAVDGATHCEFAPQMLDLFDDFSLVLLRRCRQIDAGHTVRVTCDGEDVTKPPLQPCVRVVGNV